MENEVRYVMCIISAPEAKAEEMAHQLVAERYAAAAQVTGRIKSFYWWEGKLNTNPEVLIFLKTIQEKVAPIRELLKTLHPYQVPELTAMPLIDGNPDYFRWITETIGQAGSTRETTS